MSVRIRPLRHSEHERWQEMFIAYGAFYKTEVPESVREEVWRWVFDEAEPFWCDVAENDQGQLIGFTQYQLMHRSLGGSQVVYLSDLYVDPDLRGGGTGRALIEHVINFARKEGYPNVRWLTQEYNYRGRTLYDKFAPRSDFILYAVPVEQSSTE